MNYSEIIITIGAFIINSYIFSIYLIPQIKKLRSIKSRLKRFQFTQKPDPFLPATQEAKETAEKNFKEDVYRLNSILEEYEIEYKDFQKLLNYAFRASSYVFIALFIIFTFDLFLKLEVDSLSNFRDFIHTLKTIKWKEFIDGITFLKDEFKEFILFLYIVLLLRTVYLALSVYIVKPGYLESLSYLIEEKRINGGELFKAIEFSASYGIQNGPYEKINRTDPFSIFLNTKIKVRGYRYLFLVVDQSELKYANCGLISETAQIKLLEHRELDFIRYSVPIGEFPLSALPEKKYTLFLFIFDPCIYNSPKNSPLYGKTYFNTGKGAGFTISTSDEVKISNYINFRPIQYDGEGINIEKIEWDYGLRDYPEKEYLDVIKDAIYRYRRKIRKADRPNIELKLMSNKEKIFVIMNKIKTAILNFIEKIK